MKTDCANAEGIFRIIQSIPSAKAEPFKLWLAKIAKERIDEIENPELGMDRVKSLCYAWGSYHGANHATKKFKRLREIKK